MGKIYIGVNGVAKEVKKIYIGVNGVAKEVKNAYVGVAGVAKKIFTSSVPFPSWSYDDTLSGSSETKTTVPAISASDVVNAIDNLGAVKVHYDFEFTVSGSNSTNQMWCRILCANTTNPSTNQYIYNYSNASGSGQTVTYRASGDILLSTLNATQLSNLRTNGLFLYMYIYPSQDKSMSCRFKINDISFA